MRDKWKIDVGQMADRTILEWNGIVRVLYSIPQIIMYLTRVRKFYSQYGSYVNNNLVSIVYEVIWIITINNSL